MQTTRVSLGPMARRSAQNADRLMKKAEAVAASITVPPGVEFARFEYAGRTYALSARLLVEVELLTSRVPDIVVRQGEMVRGSRTHRRR